MTNRDLAKSYIWKAETRLDALEALRKRQNYSDVVREAQETVELALKGMLRAIGVEPPKYHDVAAFSWNTATDLRQRLPNTSSGQRLFLNACARNGNWPSMAT
jgi:HEPN domain-containing protein